MTTEENGLHTHHTLRLPGGLSVCKEWGGGYFNSLSQLTVALCQKPQTWAAEELALACPPRAPAFAEASPQRPLPCVRFFFAGLSVLWKGWGCGRIVVVVVGMGDMMRWRSRAASATRQRQPLALALLAVGLWSRRHEVILITLIAAHADRIVGIR